MTIPELLVKDGEWPTTRGPRGYNKQPVYPWDSSKGPTFVYNLSDVVIDFPRGAPSTKNVIYTGTFEGVE